MGCSNRPFRALFSRHLIVWIVLAVVKNDFEEPLAVSWRRRPNSIRYEFCR